MSNSTEAQKKFERPPTYEFDVFQFSDMEMWAVRRTTVEVVALSPTRSGAIEITNAFTKANGHG